MYISWLDSGRVTHTDTRVWRVEIVPMYMVTGTCWAAWLVAYREVHRVERRKELKLLVPEKLHTGAEWSMTTEDEV